jgi:hypothetical protein
MKTLSSALTAIVGSAVVAGGIAVTGASGVASADYIPTATPIVDKTPGVPQAQVGRQCSIDAYGRPGTMTFTLHVRQNTCNFRIHAYANCGGLKSPHNGTEIQGTGDSVVSCWEAADGTVGSPYGYWYFDWRSGQWEQVGLG